MANFQGTIKEFIKRNYEPLYFSALIWAIIQDSK